MFVGSSEAVVNILGVKGSAVLVNAFRSSSNIYGAAAMKSAAKMLRGNAITGIASVVILSTGDICNIFRGRISEGQLFKNIAGTASTVAGGTAGWVGGAAAGAAVGSVVPIVGTAVGGLIGGLAGAFGGGSLAGKDLKDMYASGNRVYYAKMMLLPYIEKKTANREKIGILTQEKLQYGLKLVLENITDSDEYKRNIGIEMM